MSKHTLDQKYKDRDPKETVEILTKFFSSNGYSFKIDPLDQTESGSWWCSVLLYFNGIKVAHANGKGTTKDYCLASGLAELYERQCNGASGFLDLYTVNDYVKKNNFKNYGYYLDPNEKELTVQEAMSNSKRIAMKYDLLNDHKGNLEKYLSLLFDNHFIGVPFKGVNVDNTKYLMPELVFSVTGSDGMAAGNTVEEALVQGMSEVFEHYCWDRIYDECEHYYFLDLDNMNITPYIQEMIDNIKAHGYTMYVIDFSYNFNIPVLAIYIVNNENHTMFLNLGAHPTFNIALERLITEIYQGYNKLVDKRKNMMWPSRVMDLDEMRFMNSSSLTGVNAYVEECFYKRVIVNDYNHDVFLDQGSYSNDELLQYYINLSNKLGWDFYYRDWSMIPEMKGIHVYVDNQEIFTMSNMKIKRLTDNQKTLLLKSNIEQLNLILNYYHNGILDPNYINIFKRFSSLMAVSENIVFSHSFMVFDFAQLYNRNRERCSDLYEGFSTIKNFDTLYQVLLGYDLAKYTRDAINYYKLLFVYRFCEKYTDEEIKEICKIYNMDYTEEDYILSKNPEFFVKKIIFESFYNEAYSERYRNYLEAIYQRRQLING